jgi:hypothetical protein
MSFKSTEENYFLGAASTTKTETNAGSEFVTAVNMKRTILWDVTPFSPVEICQRFVAT